MRRMKKKRASKNKVRKENSNIDSAISTLRLEASEPVTDVASVAPEPALAPAGCRCTKVLACSASTMSSASSSASIDASKVSQKSKKEEPMQSSDEEESILGSGKPKAANNNQKSEEKANELRQDGNLYFRKGDTTKALSLYTQSLVLAPPNSLAFALALSNRAAVLKHMGHYADSIAESQRSLKAGYPELNSYVLYFRQGLCYRKLDQDGRAKKCFNIAVENVKNNSTLSEMDKVKNEKMITAEMKLCQACDEEEFEDLTGDKSIGVLKFDVPTLGSKVNPEIPTVADCIALKYSETYGRHLVAARDIKPGEVLIVEEPFSAFLDPSHCFSHCSHCFKLCRTLLPCQHCTWAMFCSEACIEESRSYHQLECAVMPGFMEAESENCYHLTARVVTSAGYNNLQSFFEQQRNEDKTSLSDEQKRTAGFNKDGKFISSDISTISNLCPNIMFARKFPATIAKMTLSLIKGMHFDELPCVFDLAGFVKKFFASITNNCISVTEFHKEKDFFTGDIKPLGPSIYPTFALMNHGCHTNLFYNFYGKTLVVRSAELIKKGSLIVTNSGKSFLWFPKHIRQKHTLTSFGFLCKCEPCEENWPEHDDLLTAPFYPHPVEIAPCSKQMASINLLLKKAIGNLKTGWRVEKHTLPLFLNHIMLLQNQGKFLNQQYFMMQECVRCYYNMQGNHVGSVQEDGLVREKGARLELVAYEKCCLHLQ